MSEPARDKVLDSGLVAFRPDRIDALPEEPGHFRLRTSGQRVMMVGHAGAHGLRAAVRELLRAHAVAGIATLEYNVTDTPEAAREAADHDITTLRPLYNEGMSRYRNTDLPTMGHGTRRATQHP